MKKTVSFFVTVIVCLFCTVLPVCAEGRCFDWYCAHVKGHVQPTVGRDVAFAETEGAYFLDRRHSSFEDTEKVIYLTFDAGYENGNVERILDVLKEEEVPAAFFILGHLVKENTALVKRMHEEGHTVCNHTKDHDDLSRMNSGEMLEALKALETLYKEHTGYELSHYYRPPCGRFSLENLRCAKEHGYIPIFWSFAYADWDCDRQPSLSYAKKKILENLHNGEVMLLHPTSETNARILGGVIREMKRLGYRFGTLDELTGRSE